MPKADRALSMKQRHEIGMPTVCAMEPLSHDDFALLERQGLLAAMFLPSPSTDDRYEAFRSLLIYRMVKAARNYRSARQAVLDQIAECKRWETDLSGGQGLPILNFGRAFDDCLSDLFAIGRTIRTMRRHRLANRSLETFLQRHDVTLKRIEAMRSKSDHMDEEIEDRLLNGGPSQPLISASASHGMVGPVSVELALLGPLLDDLFDALKVTFNRDDPGAAFPEATAP